jgi:hypothetical protein
VRPARLLHFALLDSPDVDELLEPALPELEVTVRLRATDGGRFDEMMSGRAGLALDSMEPWARHEIARCQRYATLSAAAPDSSARALVQAAEAVLFALAEAGELSWALDATTSAWRTPEQILALPSSRPFAADEHFIVVVEAVERAPGAGHLVRTRGLGKFGRPDVAMHAPRAEAERAADWVRQVARRGALGEPFLPGRRLSLPSLPPLALWPRTDDGLSPAPADEAPIYELKAGGLSLVR